MAYIIANIQTSFFASCSQETNRLKPSANEIKTAATDAASRLQAQDFLQHHKGYIVRYPEKLTSPGQSVTKSSRPGIKHLLNQEVPKLRESGLTHNRTNDGVLPFCVCWNWFVAENGGHVFGGRQ